MNHRVAILGGPGFIGRYIVKRLAERGDVLAVGGRHAAAAKFLKLKGDVGQVGLFNIADAAVRCLDDPASAGRTYELGGPKVYTLRALIELLLEELRRKRLLIDVPFGIASLQARLMAILPNPPLTADQVEMLKRDNIVSSGALTLATLGIAPTTVEAILPTYLDRFRRGGWYERQRMPITRAD